MRLTGEERERLLKARLGIERIVGQKVGPLAAGGADSKRKSLARRFTLPERRQSMRRTSGSSKIRVSPHDKSRTRRTGGGTGLWGAATAERHC